MKREPPETLRLDRWLHTARFYKTRSKAGEAVDGGKVQVNGSRVRRAKEVRPGDRIRIRQGPFEYQIVVKGIRPRRVSAAEAAALYEESEASRSEREKIAWQIKNEPRPEHREGGRPTKKDRRDLERLRRKLRG